MVLLLFIFHYYNIKKYIYIFKNIYIKCLDLPAKICRFTIIYIYIYMYVSFIFKWGWYDSKKWGWYAPRSLEFVVVAQIQWKRAVVKSASQLILVLLWIILLATQSIFQSSPLSTCLLYFSFLYIFLLGLFCPWLITRQHDML